MSPIKQRRNALLIAPEDLIVVTERRGRLWVSDRFALVRADLFKQPPAANTGAFLDADAERARRGAVKTRALLRGIRFGDTEHAAQDRALTDAVGDNSVTWFKIGSRAIYVSANRAVCAGYATARLKPRFHHATGCLTWWSQVNRDQHSLMALCMPRAACPEPRGSKERA
jgi:hypothetical protein